MSSFDLQPHLEPLRRYARVLTRGGHSADDLVQGALLRAYERRATFRAGADLRVWLMSILHNHFVDQSRARASSALREQAWAEASPSVSLPQGEHVVRLDQLRRAFMALPADQREALHLMAVEGLSVAEAADILSIPAGTVMSRVGRARAALRHFEDGGGARAIAAKAAQNSDQSSDQPRFKLLRGRDDI